MKGSGFLAIWSDVPSERETDYLHWLTREHTSERLGVPGFQGVRIFRALRHDISRYFIRYELASSDVLSSAAYIERLDAPTSWSQRIMPILGNFVRGGGKVIGEVGTGHGCIVAPIRIDSRPELSDRPKLESIVASDRIIAARLMATDFERTTIATREKDMRAGDGSFAGLLLIEGLDQQAVLTAASCHHPNPDIYTQIFEL